jgi:septal ring factor EnvC (AmiA/AmiB activator)
MAGNEVFDAVAEEIGRLSTKLAREVTRLQELGSEKKAADTMTRAVTTNLAELNRQCEEAQKDIASAKRQIGEAHEEASRIVAAAKGQAAEIVGAADKQAAKIIAAATTKAKKALEHLA